MDCDDVPCQDFLAEVYLLLDCECDESRREQLDQHIRECHPCLETYGIERDLKSLVRRGCSGEKAPDDLRLKLRDQLRSLVSAAGATPSAPQPNDTLATSTTTTTTQTRLSEDGTVTRVSATTWQISSTRPLDR